MIGTIMIVRTMIAVKYPVPTVFGGPKSGMKPSVEWSAGSTWSRRSGRGRECPRGR